jgi:transposase
MSADGESSFQREEQSKSKASAIGVDLAKHVLQVRAVDGSGSGKPVRRQLRRDPFLAFFKGRPRCLVGMEACAGAHHWGRQLQEMGHEIRLMLASYVKRYVKRGKTDAAAICPAVDAVCSG